MRIIIFDDDKGFTDEFEQVLNGYLKEKGINNCRFEIVHDEGTVYRLRIDKDDILFLDISTPENENFGIEAAKYLRDRCGEFYVIFITSHGDKIRDALSGLVRPAEFLTKPLENIERERLFMVLDAIFVRAEKRNISFNVGNTVYSIPSDDILYIRRENRKTALYTQNQCLMLRETFTSVFEKLGEGFVVIDKGTAVNIDEIWTVDPKKRLMYLRNGKELYYARDRAKELRRYFIGKEMRK